MRCSPSFIFKMANIYNSELTKQLIDGAKLQTGRDTIPNQIAEKVVPVMEVNPKLLRRTTIVRTVATAGTIYTTPTNQDFYLTGVQYSLTKDATCDLATGRSTINAVIGGLATEIIGHVTITLTAYNQTITKVFDHPLKIDRGTNITCSITTTAGVCVRFFSINGFIDETSNA